MVFHLFFPQHVFFLLSSFLGWKKNSFSYASNASFPILFSALLIVHVVFGFLTHRLFRSSKQSLRCSSLFYDFLCWYTVLVSEFQTSIPTEKDQRRRGWVVSVPVKEEGRSRESYVESARNGFRKFLLFAFLHGRWLSFSAHASGTICEIGIDGLSTKNAHGGAQAPFLFDFDCSYASCMEILNCFPSLFIYVFQKYF